MSRLSNNYDELLKFIEDAVGPEKITHQWPRVDRLVTMWIEFRGLSKWLAENHEIRGERMYKDTLATLNGLMQNIRNLENDLDLYGQRHEDDDQDNEVTEAFKNL